MWHTVTQVDDGRMVGDGHGTWQCGRVMVGWSGMGMAHGEANGWGRIGRGQARHAVRAGGR